MAGPSFGEYGPPPSVVKRIADDIMADTKRYGDAPRSDQPTGPRGNRHLDGDGYGTDR